MGKAIADQAIKPSVVTNWNTWKPGNQAAAALLKPSGALADLLDKRKIDSKIRQMSDTKLDRIGSRLADGLAAGDSPDEMARSIRGEVEDPHQALTIAVTEGAYAQCASTVARYREAGIKLVQWITADPCEACAENEAISADGVPIGEAVFIDSDGGAIDQPPAHPNCRCDVVAVVDSAF